MQLIPVTCDHCGASLEIPDGANFVTCRYCSSQLAIHRTDSAITTQVLQRIDQTTTAMAQDLQAIRRETEIERLDREWAERQSQLLTRDEYGNTSRPSAVGGIVAALGIGGFGIFWTIMAYSITAPHAAPTVPGFPGGSGFGPSAGSDPTAIAHIVLPLFGIAFIIVAVVMGLRTFAIAGKYDAEEREYQSRRRQLLAAPRSAPTSANSTDANSA